MVIPKILCASIDAQIRNWDVLPAPRTSSVWQRSRSWFGSKLKGPVGGLSGLYMRKVLALLVLGVSLSCLVLNAQTSQPTIPVNQIHAGMSGVAYTVFEGVKPEPMDVEVLGVLHNVNGPKGDIILVRLHGKKVEYTGVVAGMSGSPVYLDGKLAGALAFRIGEFSKEPIAGVTPIADMLEINEFDKSPGGITDAANSAPAKAATKTSGPGMPQTPEVQGYANYLKPIEAPLVFNGFSEEAVKMF